MSTKICNYLIFHDFFVLKKCNPYQKKSVQKRDGLSVSIIKGGLDECGSNQYCSYAGTFSQTTVNDCEIGSFRGPVSGTCQTASHVTELVGYPKEFLGISFISQCYAGGGRLPFKSELMAQGLSPADYWYVSGNTFQLDAEMGSSDVNPVEFLYNIYVPFDMTAEQMLKAYNTRSIIKCVYDD